MEKLNAFIDLFAGIGGFRIAMESAGLQCTFSSEWDKYSQKTYKENFGEEPAGDITKINEKDIPSHDVLCAGFPCQAFSISGKQKGFDDTRGTLFFDICRIAKEKKPKVLFLENVKNLKRHNKGETFKKIVQTLEEMGYNVFHEVLNASYYGAPTARERVYFVCFRKDLGITQFKFPPPKNEKVFLKDLLENDRDLTSYEIKRDDIKVYKSAEQQSQLRPLQIGTINAGGQGERIYSTNGHAITLSAYGGGAASKTGAYMINGKIRKLTERECARVMGFPDTFKIPVSKSQAYKQFGNSVVVTVLKKITEQILTAYYGEEINGKTS
ncbi:MAG: DNA cytosine methyltransferase [Candidatus Nanoarchaeia archaeon]|nr:DNA cytosine methyltransferase [Candidatus Nanoarchaeia archaeon]